jgi:hypothetical protein
MEHRWGQRFVVDMPVRLATRPYTVCIGRVKDLSMSGAHIQTALDLRILCRVQVDLVLPSRPSRTTPVLSAYVARRHRDGIGVEWCEFGPQAVVELLRSWSAAHLREHTMHPVARSMAHGS